jgi:hypothetical protein
LQILQHILHCVLFRVFASILPINTCCKQIIGGCKIKICEFELTKFWLIKSYHVSAVSSSPSILPLHYISLYSFLPYKHSVQIYTMDVHSVQ